MDWRASLIAITIAVTAAISPSRLFAQELRLIGSGASFPFPSGLVQGFQQTEQRRYRRLPGQG